MAAIAMACNPQENHKRTKHIQIAFHSTRDYVKNNVVKITHVSTQNQLADFMTKSLSGVTLRKLLTRVGLLSSKSRGELELLTPQKVAQALSALHLGYSGCAQAVTAVLNGLPLSTAG